MILHLLRLLCAHTIESCDLPVTDKFVLTKFFKPYCPYSKKIIPVMEEIESRLERANANVIIRNKDCTKCECKTTDAIITVPTLVIHKDGVEIARHRGSGDYPEYSEFVAKSMNLDKNIFKRKTPSTENNAIELYQHDFDGGLSGPWLVHFYDTLSNDTKLIFNEIAKKFEGKLSVGLAQKNRNSKAMSRLRIYMSPFTIGLYNTLFEVLHLVPSVENISDFVEKLLEPSFQIIDEQKLSKLKNVGAKGTPIYVVFTDDMARANAMFRIIAHEYKFSAPIYKSEDKEIMKKEGISFREDEHTMLTVYKNGDWFKYQDDMMDSKKVYDWIFHTHFPYIQRIRNENFYTVFHGYKPSVLLITRKGEFIEQHELVSEEYHVGLPFSDYTFSTLDLDEFTLFMETLLPGLVPPVVTVFLPSKQYFFYKKGKLTEETYGKHVKGLIKDYESGKLLPYPITKRSKWLYILLLACFILGAMTIIKKTILDGPMKKKYNQNMKGNLY